MCIAPAAARRHLCGRSSGREAWLQLLAACQDTVQPPAGLAYRRGACSWSSGCVSAGCVRAARCAPSGCLLPFLHPGPWTRQCNATVTIIACCMPVATRFSRLLHKLVVVAFAAGVVRACSLLPASVSYVGDSCTASPQRPQPVCCSLVLSSWGLLVAHGPAMCLPKCTRHLGVMV